MAKLIYTAITSLDGYIADEHGEFDWAAPDSDVHAFINDLERPIGTYLYGRRLYEVMVFWETAPAQPNQPPVGLDYAKLWQARRQDRVLHDLGDREQRPDPDRADVRPERCPGDEGRGRARSQHRRSSACRPRVPSGVGGRGPPVRVPAHRRRRQSVSPRPAPSEPSTTGRAQIRQRRRVPAVPSLDLTARHLRCPG
jgi:hypothetical protein